MKASELIKRLQELVEEYGDCRVVDYEMVEIKGAYHEDEIKTEAFIVKESFILE